jgi:glycosyltransferase involved in cell wall biosynthesis
MKPKLSALFVSFNRSDLLAMSLSALRDPLRELEVQCEVVVTDDGSSDEHLRKIKSLPFDRYVLAARNSGIGINTNKGLAEVAGEYILQVQDDCQFCGSANDLRRALKILDFDPDVGIVQLVSSFEAEILESRRTEDGVEYVIFRNDGIGAIRPCGDRPYSDQPHIKRRQFVLDIGTYLEGVPMTTAELDYQRRVANQHRWYVAAIPGCTAFIHLGADRSFNPSVRRARMMKRLDGVPLLGQFFRSSRLAIKAIRDRFFQPGQ